MAAVNKNGGDEAAARIRQREAARREGVTIEKKSAQREGVGKIGGGNRLNVFVQETRQPQEPVPIRFARVARDRAAGARRHIDEISVRTGHRAGVEVEPEAEFAKEGKLEARDHGGDRYRIVERIEDSFECGVNAGMRLAFRQQTAQGREMGDAVHGMPRRGKPRRMSSFVGK